MARRNARARGITRIVPMILALDSSALLCIFNNEPGADAWLEALVGARRQGPLIVCVVYAELAPAFAERGELKAVLSHLGARFDLIQSQAAWLAGSTFKTSPGGWPTRAFDPGLPYRGSRPSAGRPACGHRPRLSSEVLSRPPFASTVMHPTPLAQIFATVQ